MRYFHGAESKLFPPSLIKCGHVHPGCTHAGQNVDLETVFPTPRDPDEGQCWEPALLTAGGILESLQVLLAHRATFLGEEAEDSEIRARAAWALSCDRSRLSSLSLLVPS